MAQASASEMGKLNKLKLMKDVHTEDMLVIQQQQAIFNDATSFNNLTEDLRKLSSDASRHRNRSAARENQEENKHETSRKHDKTSEAGRSSGKAKHSASAIANFSSQNETKTTTTTSLAISFSSPNLATNTSFSSSSDSSDFDGACCVSSVIKVQNLLDDAFSVDDNDPNDNESLNLAGENDVEYAELTQRMIPPSQKMQQKYENVAIEDSDLMLLNLFDAKSGSPHGSAGAESSSCNSSSTGSSSTALRPISSVLDNNNLFESSGASNELAAFNSYANNLDQPSEQEAAYSLPPEVNCTSPVWKQVSAKPLCLFILSFQFVFRFISL